MTPQNHDSSSKTCPECGSAFFQEADFRQYMVFPSAMPGGGLHPSDESRQVKVCACGYPMRIFAQGRFDKVSQSLKQSLDAAERYRESRSADKILAGLADTFATQRELQALLERLGNVENLLQTRQEDPSKDKDAAPVQNKAEKNRF